MLRFCEFGCPVRGVEKLRVGQARRPSHGFRAPPGVQRHVARDVWSVATSREDLRRHLPNSGTKRVGHLAMPKQPRHHGDVAQLISWSYPRRPRSCLGGSSPRNVKHCSLHEGCTPARDTVLYRNTYTHKHHGTWPPPMGSQMWASAQLKI